MSVHTQVCRACGAGPGTLTLTATLAPNPPTAASLAGAQLKTTATTVPVLDCTACGLHLTGSYDPDGLHVTFPEPAAGAVPPNPETNS